MLMVENDQLVEQVESALRRPLEEHERAEVELWRKGRSLSGLLNSPAWETLQATIAEYPRQATEDLRRLKPGDNDRILAAHAVAYALNEFHEHLQQDLQAAIDASERTPEVVRLAAKAVSAAPAEAL